VASIECPYHVSLSCVKVDVSRSMCADVCIMCLGRIVYHVSRYRMSLWSVKVMYSRPRHGYSNTDVYRECLGEV